jgi:predicted negative regulator of RcsB-dependent stress response
MAKQHSAFSKKHIEEVTAAKRTLLEELNLPPAAIKFIRENSTAIQAVAICLFLGICGWSYYDYYTTKQTNDAAALYYHAMREPTADGRIQFMEKVVTDYSSTGSALWCRIALVHEKTPEEQVVELEKITKDVSRDDPLYPLLQYDLAQCYEMNNDSDKAMTIYKSLADIHGFAGISYLAMGRIFEQKNDLVQARDMYEKAKSQPELPTATKGRLEDRLARL